MNATVFWAGFVFKSLGEATGQKLLGAKVVASMLMFATVSGILMALFLNTAGGAWDNAKKYIEIGALGYVMYYKLFVVLFGFVNKNYVAT